MIETDRLRCEVLIYLSGVKRGLRMVVTCELRRGWQEGASHDGLAPQVEGTSTIQRPRLEPKQKAGFLEGTDGGHTGDSQRGGQRPGPGGWVVLILGLFVLRSGPRLSALGCRDWPCGLGFHGGSVEGNTAERLEGVRAREQPGFSFPCCLPSQLPSMAPAPAFLWF